MTSRDLQEALVIFRNYPNVPRKHQNSLLARLGAAGFNALEIRAITGVSVDRALKFSGEKLYGTSRKLNPLTLDALILVAVSYEDDKTVSGTLVRRIAQWGTSLSTVSRLCGIPMEELREAVHGEVRGHS